MDTIDAFDRRFPDENSCKAYLAAHRWPDGVRCPRCNRKEKVYAITGKAFTWRCRNDDCGGRSGYKFSVITHTIFQDTKIPLKHWFKVAFLIITAKKGISALQIHRVMFGEDSGHDYRTSWFMCHRWRAAMKGDVLPLEGIVEIDEAYVGGRAHNMHASKRKAAALTGTKNKVAVIGAIARKGMIVAKVIQNTDTPTLDSFVRQTVSPSVKRSRPMSTAAIACSARICLTRLCATARANTWSDRPTPTPLKDSGPCSSAASWAVITRSPRSTCCTSTNFRGVSTIGRIPRCLPI